MICQRFNLFQCQLFLCQWQIFCIWKKIWQFSFVANVGMKCEHCIMENVRLFFETNHIPSHLVSVMCDYWLNIKNEDDSQPYQYWLNIHCFVKVTKTFEPVQIWLIFSCSYSGWQLKRRISFKSFDSLWRPTGKIIFLW